MSSDFQLTPYSIYEELPEVPEGSVWTRDEVFALTEKAIDWHCERWQEAGLEAIDPELLYLPSKERIRLARWYANTKFDAHDERRNNWNVLYLEGLRQVQDLKARYWQELQLFGRPKVVPKDLIEDNTKREREERPYGASHMIPIFAEGNDMELRFRLEHGRRGIEGPSSPDDEPWSDYSSMSGSSPDEDMDDQ